MSPRNSADKSRRDSKSTSKKSGSKSKSGTKSSTASANSGAGSNSSASVSDHSNKSKKEDEPGTYKRIALIRYVRPVAPQDPWGYSMRPCVAPPCGPPPCGAPSPGSYGGCMPYPPYPPYCGYYAGELGPARKVLIVPPPNLKQYRKARTDDEYESGDDKDGSDDEPHGPHICNDLVKMAQKRTINPKTSFFKVRAPTYKPPGSPNCLPLYDPCGIANRINLNMMAFGCPPKADDKKKCKCKSKSRSRSKSKGSSSSSASSIAQRSKKKSGKKSGAKSEKKASGKK